MRGRARIRERGVAVVTALLLTTLAITIVASLFWQQQVQVRSIENQRLQLQKQWILRGALDWARLILREDRRFSGNLDTLDEPWAVPLMDTRLDQYVEEGQADTAAADAVLSGGIIDAQSRYNLTNLSSSGQIDPKQVMAYARLLSLADLNPALAQETARAMAAAQQSRASSAEQGQEGNQLRGGGNNQESSQGNGQSRPMPFIYVHDLLAIPGYTPQAIEKLREWVVILPTETKVNANTAPAEVLAAVIDGLSLADATGLVERRRTAYFRNVGDIQNLAANAEQEMVDVHSQYFLITGRVRMNRAGLEVEALVERETSSGTTELVWLQQR